MANPFTYVVASKGFEDKYAQFGKAPDIHIALKYQKKSRNENGSIVQPPHPRGISGGGLWQVPNVLHLDDVRLDGIAFEYRSTGRLVFATRIDHVLAFVRQYVLMAKTGLASGEFDG